MSAPLPATTMNRVEPISVEEALAIVLDAVGTTEVVEVPLHDSTGLTLAADIIAPGSLPTFRNSAMDGFAVRSLETVDASTVRPVVLRIAGTIMAGDAPWNGPLDAGSAVRVMTGAAIPGVCDAVIRLEDVEIDRDDIRLARSITAGEHIREIGSDVRAGTTALEAGAELSWASIALLTSLEISSIRVHRRLHVAVISTGDEIQSNAASGLSIPDSNGPMLMTMLRDCGVDAEFLGVARDRQETLESIIHRAPHADAIVTSGGVSAGDRDVVRDLLATRNARLFSQVRMKPGRPFTFGLLGRVPIFALPGNPFAAAATFLQFVQPALDRMRGRRINEASRSVAQVADRIENPSPRRLIVPVRIDAGNGRFPVAHRIAESVAGLALLARADGLLVIPESVRSVNAGDTCEFWSIH